MGLSTPAKFTIIKVLSCIDVLTYGVTLVFACRNALVYLYRQERWKTYYLTFFYTTAITVALLRVFYFASFFFYFSGWYAEVNYQIGYFTSNTAFYIKGVLLLGQAGAMFELATQLKLHANILSTETATKRHKINKIVIAICSVLLVVTAIYSFLNAHVVMKNFHEDPDWEEPDWRLHSFTYTPPVVLITISIILTVSLINLFVIMKKHYDKNLKDEASRLKNIYSVFTVTFISRAVIYIIKDHYF